MPSIGQSGVPVDMYRPRPTDWVYEQTAALPQDCSALLVILSQASHPVNLCDKVKQAVIQFAATLTTLQVLLRP